jgi:hypothetical protein
MIWLIWAFSRCALLYSSAPSLGATCPFRVQPLFDTGGFLYASDRSTPRFNLNIPVRVRRLAESGSIEYTVETSNLSEGGMYFSSDI